MIQTCNQIQVKYVSPNGYHRHQCKSCNIVWEHSNKAAGSDEAHKCPYCGREEWYHYFGALKPCYSQTVISCEQVVNHKV